MSLTSMTPDDIKAARHAMGATQAGLAQQLGASKRTIEDWEGGKRTAPPMLRLALAAINANLKPWGDGG